MKTKSYKQLELFADHEPEPQQTQPLSPYEDTWWKPKDYFRYNENGRPSGWVRIDQRYIANVHTDELTGRLYAGYYRVDLKDYSHWWYITAAELIKNFDPITRPDPDWTVPEWCKYDD